jgi:hypothetical protein
LTGYRRVATLKTPSALAEHLAQIGIDLPFDKEVLTGTGAPLAQPCQLSMEHPLQRAALAS